MDMQLSPQHKKHAVEQMNLHPSYMKDLFFKARVCWGFQPRRWPNRMHEECKDKRYLAASQMPIPTGTTGFPSLQAMNISTHHQVSNEK